MKNSEDLNSLQLFSNFLEDYTSEKRLDRLMEEADKLEIEPDQEVDQYLSLINPLQENGEYFELKVSVNKEGFSVISNDQKQDHNAKIISMDSNKQLSMGTASATYKYSLALVSAIKFDPNSTQENVPALSFQLDSNQSAFSIEFVLENFFSDIILYMNKVIQLGENVLVIFQGKDAQSISWDDDPLSWTIQSGDNPFQLIVKNPKNKNNHTIYFNLNLAQS